MARKGSDLWRAAELQLVGLVARITPTMSDCVGISGVQNLSSSTHTIRHERLDAYFIRAIQQPTARVAALELLK
jgi:hypothetical protein